MCGIAGLFATARGAGVDAKVAAAMADRLQHRGPDGSGVRAGPGYALSHRRLAIVDIQGGAQPMGTPDGKLWVTYNGEIYNYRELRAELVAGGAHFVSNSDTEVLLHGYRAWGTALASRLRGMFAFVLVDEERHELYGARDRFGKKPLHWLQHEGVFAFASELKALHECGMPKRLRADAIAQFFALRYVPDPLTVFEGVHKLPPAHWCRLRDGKLEQQRYWRPVFAVEPGSRQQHGERVLGLLDEAVRVRLMGEVPLAPFLSGGIDSYAIVDSMVRAQGSTVEACTIGFADPAFDERAAARESAAACGARLREEVLEPERLLELDWHAHTFDEPFSDASAVPTYHVSRLARRHVTVALSGDGGDEGFGGYRRYLFDEREHRARRWLPAGAWRALGACYPKFDWLPRWLRARRTLQNLGEPAAVAYARSVSAHLPEEVFAVLRREHHAAAGDPHAPLLLAYAAADATSPLHRAVATDLATWLPGDILVKADRASMATSLEVRAPFLDHLLFEQAMRVPPAWHLQGGCTKAFLRDVLRPRLLPAALARKKQGFSVPLRAWCRGPIGDAVESVLGDRELLAWIEPQVVRSLLARHRAGVGDHAEMLWAVLVFARFLREVVRVSRVVTFTSLFPSAAVPTHGLFVFERMRRVAEASGLPWQVVAPVPHVWWPLRSAAHRPWLRVAAAETWQGVAVDHPRYRHWPGCVRRQARAMAKGARATVAALAAAGRIVLDAHYLWPDGVAAGMLARELGVPFTLTARGSDLNLLADDPAIAAAIGEAAARAHACCAVSGALADRFAAVAKLPRSRVHEVRNGVDLERFAPGDAAAARAALGLPAAGRIVLGVGRLVAGKGFVAAAAAVAELGDGVTLLLVGEGPQRAAIAATCGRVRFLGALPPERTALAYRAADVLVLPSEREGWPNVVTEALASGLPVVATRVGGIPQILGDPVPGHLGALVAVGDQPGLVAALRAQMARPGEPAKVRAFAMRYGWREPVQQLVEIFRSALAEAA